MEKCGNLSAVCEQHRSFCRVSQEQAGFCGLKMPEAPSKIYRLAGGLVFTDHLVMSLSVVRASSMWERCGRDHEQQGLYISSRRGVAQEQGSDALELDIGCPRKPPTVWMTLRYRDS